MKTKRARLRSEFEFLVCALMGKELGRKVSHVEAMAAIDSFRKALKTCVRADGRVVIPGLGTFRKARRKARRIRNVAEVLDSGPPVEGDLGRAAFIELPATPEIRFRPAKAWKKALR